MNLSIFKESNLIVESTFFGFLLFKWVKLKQQNLPFVIHQIKQKGLFGFYLNYNEHEIYISQKPFRSPSYMLYLDKVLIAQIYDAKGIHVTRKYTMKTNTDDENINLYLLLLFILQLAPIG